jgi:hypothetical protein
MSADMPYYETLFGIYLNHWGWTYGSGEFVDSLYTLTKEYQNEGCLTTDFTACSSGSNTIRFLYPHWIKKKYYIEGVVEGHFTVSCDGDDDELVEYQIRLMKVDDLGNISEISSTGYKLLNYALNWDAGLGVGDEIVIPFYITISPEVEMLDKERIYVEITVNADDDYLVLYHSNDATWEDFKISIPFRGL